MNVVGNFNQRSCERYRRYFDAYLDNELLVETNQDVLQHLSSCMDCKNILESRARMKHLLKNAASQEEAPIELAAALRSRIQSERRSFFGSDTARWTMAAAAVLMAAIGIAGALFWGRVIGFDPAKGVVRTVSARVEQLLRVGLVDHVHCAILARQWKRFVTLDEMKAATGRSALGPEFIDLVPAVQRQVGSDFKVVLGHRCTAGGRRYVHLILTGKDNAILSLVITEKQNESFAEADAVAVLKASGIPIYREHQGVLEVAGFESSKYLAYVISNLNEKSNLNVASALAPVVMDHLHRLES